MPFGMKPVCSSCRVTTSTLWRKGAQGEILCNSCGLKQANGGAKETGQNSTNTTNSLSAKNGNNNGNGIGNQGSGSQVGGPVLRKSARIKPVKTKVQAATKALATKGKSRRNIFKKTPPMKAPKSVATVVTGNSIFYNGQYYQVGDIVSLMDHDRGVYYAQIRGFMCDQYSEKSAVITWLLPTQSSPIDRFDASTFILGPEEDIPRKMEFMEFVCHAPSDYFHAKNTPYPVKQENTNLCFVWTSLGPEIQTTPSVDEIFGVKDETDETLSLLDVPPAVSVKNAKEKDKEKKDDRNFFKMEID